MRTLQYGGLLIVALIATATAMLFWSEDHRMARISHTEKDPADLAIVQRTSKEQDRASESVHQLNQLAAPSRNLYDDVMRYMSAEELSTRNAIVSEVAYSEPHFWESCALRMGGEFCMGQKTDNILGQFASAYFNRGPKQKQELISLLQSRDLHVVRGLLSLLQNAYVFDMTGKRPIAKHLGASEIPPYISRIARDHPSLSMSVASALAAYGDYAKSEVPTLLRMILARNEHVSAMAILSLIQVDHGLYKRFGLDGDGLTDGQRIEIENYLRDTENIVVRWKFRRFSIMLILPRVGKRFTIEPAQEPNNSLTPSSTLYDDITRYRLAKDDAARSAIANDVASSQTDIWQSCALRIFFTNTFKQHNDIERDALAHFASAYYKRGPRQKEELTSLLQSRNPQLVVGLLWLLRFTRDLGPNGELQADKPMGVHEIPPYISRIARAHPKLENVSIMTLSDYGHFAKSETATIMKVILSDDKVDSRNAKRALFEVDPRAYAKFGIDPDKPLTNEQKTEIKKYLELNGEK